MFSQLIDFILHIDEHLVNIVQSFVIWSYGILFLIVFIETGLVIMPFLPGDSLLFAAAALAPQGALNIYLLFIVCALGAILGDTVNYQIGKSIGVGIVHHPKLGRFIKEEHMEKATSFFNKHGGKTIVIARFMPFIRTFIPFIAGTSEMKYRYFLTYNVIGAILWVGICLGLGYFFGNIPFVKNNFEILLIVIVILSIIPAIIGGIQTQLKKKA